jgi:hypothetical protein
MPSCSLDCAVISFSFSYSLGAGRPSRHAASYVAS